MPQKWMMSTKWKRRFTKHLVIIESERIVSSLKFPPTAFFTFPIVGLGPGTVLQSVFDDTITCTVKGDRWVEFRGQEHSLSSSALEIAHEKGLGWSAVAGPDYWKYEGKTLSELREEKATAEE
jgi:hypothetical protein